MTNIEKKVVKLTFPTVETLINWDSTGAGNTINELDDAYSNGSTNITFGHKSTANVSAVQNIIIGHTAGGAITRGSANVLVGSNAGTSL